MKFSITENEFYELLDEVETYGNITNGWYPYVRELKEKKVENNMTKFKNLVFFFASDPFKRMNISAKEDKEYKETVKYCKKIVSEINLILKEKKI